MPMYPPTVALADWSWSGHHPTYFSFFASALSDLGVRVLPLCPEPGQFLSAFRTTPAGQTEEGRSRVESPLGLTFPSQVQIRPARFRPVIQGVTHFARLGRQLRRWEREHDRRVDLVFFACIYDLHFQWFRLAAPLFRFPWSGLYLHARSFRMPGSVIPYHGILPCPERIFTSPGVRSVGLLDEGILGEMRTLSGRRAFAFPDLADVRVPKRGEPGRELADELLAFASGRPVISLVGHLQRTKGLLEFTRLAEDPELQDVVFFLGGEVNWSEISAETQRWMLDVWEQQANVFRYPGRIPDELSLNGVMDASDVIFAAYTDFPNSSNILTKAAFLNRPVIVSDGFLMAERTREFQLGVVVPEGDVPAQKAGIRTLLSQKVREGTPVAPVRQAYMVRHSYPALVEAFAEILGPLAPAKRSPLSE